MTTNVQKERTRRRKPAFRGLQRDGVFARLARFGSRSLDFLCEFIFPTTCVVCERSLPCPNGLWRRRELPLDSLICPDCRKRLVAKTGAFCARCGRTTSRPYSDSLEFCGRCESERFEFDAAIPLQFYRDFIRSYILRIKRDRNATLAKTIARLYLEERRGALKAFKPDCVVPVPMHWRRKRLRRGVNSPETIAKRLAKGMNIPVVLGKVRRIRATETQASVDFDARSVNVRNAFAIGCWKPNDEAERWEDLSVERQTQEIEALRAQFGDAWETHWDAQWRAPDRSKKRPLIFAGKRVLLVDDVATSCATANELARLLRKAGAKSVAIAVLARAGLQKR